MNYFKNLAKIQETEGQIVEIENFLFKNEIDEIINYVNSTKNIFVDRDDVKRISFNTLNSKPVRKIEHWEEIFKKILLKKIEKLFKNVDFYVNDGDFPPHILKLFYPTKLHTDTGKNNSDKILYKQLLIPLEINPTDGEVYTIFFKNRYYETAANFREKSSKVDPIYIKDKNEKFIKIPDLNNLYSLLKKNKESTDITYNEGCFHNSPELKNKILTLMSKDRYNNCRTAFNENKPFSKEIYEKFLTHSDIGDYNGMEFWKAIKWKVGNVIIWDRSIPHSSNNFLKSNVISKTGLSIFFNRN